MRTHTFGRLTPAAAAAVLLLGCGTEPLEPRAGDVRMALTAAGVQVAAPSNVTAVATSDSTIRITWQDNSSNETRFDVYRSTTGYGGEFVLLSSTGENVTTYTDRGLSAGTQYCYEMRAVRVKGNNVTLSYTFSNTACALTTQPPPPPPPPPPAAYATSATPMSGSSVLVNWTAVGLNFRIDRSTDGGATWEMAGTVYNDRYFYDFALPSEQPVCYRVVNYNETGTAEPSNTACTTPPAAPTGLTATAVDAQTLELTWSDNSAVEDGYEVWEHLVQGSCCYEGSGCNSGWSEGDNLLARLPANTTTYRTPGVLGQDVCGSSNSLEVRATKDGGYASGGSYIIDP